ncbi:unnamed protein product [Orchesella dallaii]|uniref:Uncharacterized protein n=1 Tax=Orchesella dallaii TaxID=48710 RepID=A0ABP1PY23_9HEXA
MGAEQSSLIGSDVRQNNVTFFINGKEYNVKSENEPDVGPTTLLIDYIRDKAGLKGTKYMCREGGCGACVVMVKSRDPNTGSDMIRAINSCLLPVFACDGMDISTIESLGNRKQGYHDIQKQLVKFSGTQCGFCTSGMIMNMHSLCQSKPGYKAQDVEDTFDGNICRCTGYRPILDAFKSMAMDASEELKRKYADVDVEDCSSCPCVSKANISQCKQNDGKNTSFETCCSGGPVYIKLKSGEEWLKPTSLESLYEALGRFSSSGMKYRLVAGNTGTGVFKYDGPYQVYIDINNIPELKQSKVDASEVSIGANVTISMAIDLLQKASELDGYSYTADMVKHIKRVANLPVRNAATLAGNLMIKQAHREFPSDIFLLLETVAAKLRVGLSPTLTKDYSPLEFRELDMNGKVILSIHFPAYKGNEYFFRSFKVTRRHQNAHAYVNAAFLFKVDYKNNFTVREKPTICFGGINPDFVHATGTEMFFIGKALNASTLAGAMESLQREVVPDYILPDATPEYRRGLTQSLLYKVILGIYGDTEKAINRSGATDIERGLHYGKQTYDTDQSKWPLYQPVAKLEAFPQTSGEAEYINDMHPLYGELFGAFVLTTVGNASLKYIDTSEALMIPGVIGFVHAKDIPGVNNYSILYPEKEEIFVSEKVQYAGQPVGLIMAENRQAAFDAVKKVNVIYDNVQRPILDIAESINIAEKAGKAEELILTVCKSPDKCQSEKVAQTIKGEFRSGSQYHFHMETQIAICVPKEDGMDVYSASQFLDSVQLAIASALAMSSNSINISVKRLGGGYGGKISKAAHVAAACAVAAHVINRPVRVAVDLETNMKMIGKRAPYLTKYEAGIDNDGKIQSLNAKIFCDPGYVGNEATSLFAMVCSQSCYRAVGWEVVPGKALTNTAPNTYCRAPGSTRGISIIENIMEHVAWAVKKDPLEVRMANFIQTGDPLISVPGAKFEGENRLPKMIEDLKETADYDSRKKFVETFNQNNRWKKRGLAMVPMRYPQHYHDTKFPAYIAVYHMDGTVAVSHGGIEMGQGINTKVAQVVAYTLKIPLDKVKVKAFNTLLSPNAAITGGACTSELVSHAAMKACEKLLETMAEVREEMKDQPWEKIVHACYMKGMQLTAHHQDMPGDVKPYDIWGLTLIEVLVDILTGEFKIVRADIVEDVGKSLNPEVDIGQIEGSIAMGLGLWTTEKLVYDKNTGQLLTNGTWEYKVPLHMDVPEDLRVTMLRNAPNPFGVLASKATGEPPLVMSCCILFAIRNAIQSARNDAGNTEWFQMDGPVTPEDIFKMSLATKEQFNL